MTFLSAPPALWQFMLVWPLPVYIAMARDYVAHRLVHPVYVIGILTMLAMRLVMPLRFTETWYAISGWLAGFFSA
jgi:hypothetical protein